MAEWIGKQSERAGKFPGKFFMKGVVIALFLVLCFLYHKGWAEGPRPQPSLTDAVLIAAFPLSGVDSTDYDGSLRACVDRYLADGELLLRGDRMNDDPERGIAVRRWRLERHITVILGPAVMTDARLFAGGVPLGLEWEGMSARPLREAEYAEDWLKRYPRSPLVPFLHLFAAHRYRSAFEAAGLEKDGDLLPIAGRKHREHLRAARSAGNDKINCIADDMDTLPYVYLSGFGRP